MKRVSSGSQFKDAVHHGRGFKEEEEEGLKAGRKQREMGSGAQLTPVTHSPGSWPTVRPHLN